MIFCIYDSSFLLSLFTLNFHVIWWEISLKGIFSWILSKGFAYYDSFRKKKQQQQGKSKKARIFFSDVKLQINISAAERFELNCSPLGHPRLNISKPSSSPSSSRCSSRPSGKVKWEEHLLKNQLLPPVSCLRYLADYLISLHLDIDNIWSIYLDFTLPLWHCWPFLVF